MTSAGITVRPLERDELDQRIGELAALRIAVFRAYPYLYVGDADYERTYLRAYADSPDAVVIGAFRDDGALVGAATAAPMVDHAAEFAAPFAAQGYDLSRIYYFGESVLLPEWRGRGVGHAFFDAREAAASRHGFGTTCFCAVVRPPDHPLRPTDYSPLDPLWRKRGYSPVAGLVASYDWPEEANGPQISHTMQFWLRTA